jgi:hypothetical protein
MPQGQCTWQSLESLPTLLPIMLLQTCKSKLEKIKRDQEAMRQRQYQASSCPICLEDFTPSPGQTSQEQQVRGCMCASVLVQVSSGVAC